MKFRLIYEGIDPAHFGNVPRPNVWLPSVFTAIGRALEIT